MTTSEETSPGSASEPKKRGKYGRPCDGCASRRVRCVPGDGKCLGCLSHGIPCTQNRVRKKLGPKSRKTDRADMAQQHPFSFLPLAMHDMASDTRENDVLNIFQYLDPYTARISLDSLLPTLQVYQTWFYGYWPVLSVADLMLTLVDVGALLPERHIRLTPANAHLYALCCAVCAAITTQVLFLLSRDKVLHLQTLLGTAYADEAKRVRNLFDYTAHTSVDTVLSSFFLYAHYVNNLGLIPQAIMYLREAITVAQLMSLHEPELYVGKSAAEVHRRRKIYYMLLVTERFMCFEDAMPVVLDPCVEFPELENEEYPQLLVGFTELVRVFAIPNKKFFGEMNQKGRTLPAGQLSLGEKRQWIQAVQKKLARVLSCAEKVLEAQRLNILLSRSWIRAIAWHITSENGLLRSLEDADDCFDVDFPVANAREFLLAAGSLLLFAFEANGPGICVKLLEMAHSLTCAFAHLPDRYAVLDTLDSVFCLVNVFRNDLMLPVNVYQRVSNLLSAYKMSRVPRPMGPKTTIAEILDDDDEAAVAEPLKITELDDKDKPATPDFLELAATEMALAFSRSADDEPALSRVPLYLHAMNGMHAMNGLLAMNGLRMGRLMPAGPAPFRRGVMDELGDSFGLP